MPPRERIDIPFRRVTPAGRHHFFGYYEKTPWDPTGRFLLALETDFDDHMPAPDEPATIGIVDTADGDCWHPVGTTRAWNFQQGAMLGWLPDGRIVYNDRIGSDATAAGPGPDLAVAIVRDLPSGDARVLPRPLCALRPDGREMLSISYARLAHCRPVCGYPGLVDPFRDDPHPAGDGVWRMDIATGDARLIVDLARAAALRPLPSMEGRKHWFNHLVWNPDGTRFAFLHRWRRDLTEHWHTRLLVADADGHDVRILADDDMASHFEWRDPDHLFGWFRILPEGDHYYAIDVRTGAHEIVAPDVLTADGHCSFDPVRRRWLLTDTYPHRTTRERSLILYDTETGRRVDVGAFHSPPGFSDDVRCDLHPRWSRDGRQVCIDSVHEGTRQVYVGDVSPIVGG